MPDRSTAYAKSSVLVLDAATGRALHTLIGHTADVVGIAFSPDGSRIATASFDRTLKLWDTLTGREVFTLRGHTAALTVLAFSPDGQRIVSGSIDFTARVWDATPLPAEVLRAQDAHYRRKREALGELARTTADTQQADNLARNGQWDLAAAAFDKLVEKEPDNSGLRHPHIRSLVEAGDKAGVRRACEDLLKRYGISPDLTKVKDVVWSCVLAPDVVADREAPVRLAESYLALHPEEKGPERSDALRILGAALDRAGRFEEAIRRLGESNQARDDAGDPKAFAFLALTHHRLGHSDEAGRWLDKLAAYRPKAGADFFWDEVEIRILRREAESLILGSTLATPPTAPATPTKSASGVPAGKAE
jgi:tetratricopeptide (TPR) repeat protein